MHWDTSTCIHTQRAGYMEEYRDTSRKQLNTSRKHTQTDRKSLRSTKKYTHKIIPKDTKAKTRHATHPHQVTDT